MTKQAGAALAQRLVDEVAQMVPEYVKNPEDFDIGKGNAAVCGIAPDGSICGRIFGDDKARGRFSFGIVNRKVIQVWSTGYATGRFEQLVYAGKLDEGAFGVNKPDFVGWEGGVPLLTEDGALFAAAFSGFRGIKDIEIIERAAAKVGLRVKRD
jgi:glc operon protein GlcG